MQSIRQFHESRERELLDDWAFLAVNTAGRAKEEEKCDIRTDFQRDRDRILYSKAFRRLKHKTQVFISPEGDYFRTRLTHTLEVSQISRSIARALRLNEDLTEAIALGHDLGHAPFGHAGETALNGLLEKYSPGEYFKHNEQSLRVVDFLENGKGMNLTFEVRDGILKHTKGRKNINSANMSGPDIPTTAEGQIVRIADRMAYVNHDIDDALRSGIISDDELPRDAVQAVGITTSQRIGSMITDVIKTSHPLKKITMSDGMYEVIDILKEFLFVRVYSDVSLAKQEEIKARRMIETMFKYFIDNPCELPEANIVPGDSLPRRICDYISGMSDPFAIYAYEDIFVPKVWENRL